MTSPSTSSESPSDTPAALAANPDTTTAHQPASEPHAEAARPPSVFDLPIATLTPADPFRWLAKGWSDFGKHPRISVFYGFCFLMMGNALWAVFKHAPAYMLALSAGFLLMGPFLSLGLYDVSRMIESKEGEPTLARTLFAWESTAGTMAIFAFVLLILEMLWGRASLVVIAVSFNNMPDAKDMLSTVFSWENIGFLVTYAAVGAIFAGLIFVTSAVSIPMILHRRVDAISAGLTSFRVCLNNPGVMFLWGAIITVCIGLAMLPAFLGLLIVGPVIGHASWHAYRHAVPGEPEPVEAPAT